MWRAMQMAAGFIGFIACIVLAANTTAWAGTCTTATFDTYLASGFSCTVGDLEFSNFTAYADGVTGGAVAIPSSSITVTPSGSDVTSLDLTLSFGSPSIFSLPSGETSELTFEYSATPLAGYGISEIDELAPFVGLTVSPILVCIVPTCPFPSPDSTTFTIEAGVTASAITTVNSLEDKWYVEPSATPVPATLPLFGSGLAVVGLFGWRRKRKNTAAIAAA
jgi:hypothetical protein